MRGLLAGTGRWAAMAFLAAALGGFSPAAGADSSAGEQPKASLEVQIPPSCYAGERISATIVLDTPGTVRGVRFEAPFLRNPDLNASFAPGATPRSLPQRLGRRRFLVRVNGERVIARISSWQHAVRRITLPVTLRPGSPGRIELGAVTARAFSRPSGPFPAIPRRLKWSAPSKVLEVRPLPEQGRPPEFSGLIGSYELSATARPRSLRVGEPLELTLALSGPPPGPGAYLPALDEEESLLEDFRVTRGSREPVPGRVFTRYTLRPKNENVRRIPPVELSFLDPGRGVYRTARTPPLALNVTPNRLLDAGDVEGPGAEAEPEPPEERPAEIARNYEGPEALEDQSAVGAAAWLAAVPALLYFALLGWKSAPRLRAALPRRAISPAERAERRLASIEESPGDDHARHAAIMDCLHQYLAEGAGLHSRAMTVPEISQKLRERAVNTTVLDELRDLLEIDTAARYGGGGAGANGLEASRARAVVARLDRELSG